MMKTSSSRLKRNITKSNKNTAIISLAGIFLFIIAGFFLFPYIIEGIGNISQLMSTGENTQKTHTTSDLVLNPPILIDMPSATASARVIVKGKSDQNGTVQIYVNKNLQDEIEIDEKKEFESKILKLKDGTNQIATKLKTIDGESEFSEDYSIAYISKEPTVDVSYPQEGAHLTKADKRITIQGKTEAENNIKINGARAIVENDGSFSHLIELNEGENEIAILASNEAGKSTEKRIKVVYSRE